MKRSKASPVVFIVLTLFLQHCYSSLTFNNITYETVPSVFKNPLDCFPLLLESPPPSLPPIEANVYFMDCNGELPNELSQNVILVLNSTIESYCSDYKTNDVVKYFENEMVVAIVVLDTLKYSVLRYDDRNCSDALAKPVHYVIAQESSKISKLKDGDLVSLSWGMLFFYYFTLSYFILFILFYIVLFCFLP